MRREMLSYRLAAQRLSPATRQAPEIQCRRLKIVFSLMKFLGTRLAEMELTPLQQKIPTEQAEIPHWVNEAVKTTALKRT